MHYAVAPTTLSQLLKKKSAMQIIDRLVVSTKSQAVSTMFKVQGLGHEDDAIEVHAHTHTQTHTHIRTRTLTQTHTYTMYTHTRRRVDTDTRAH